ncbi:peptidylprolyl isomerase [Nocardioides gilvus]|uniref:peptidylprolyl isomerase n=1 Tax=Nocardioides gilvus TaxID=1735589 RepID=UPI000D744B8F|nr:peptidylprolyl isomerase [Nocardioides gilvus]
MPSRLRFTRPLAVVTALCALTLVGCSDDGANTSGGGDEGCTYETSDRAAVKEVKAPSDSPSYEGEVQATISTSVGDIDLVLDAAAAPCTVNSFVSLAEQGYFDDTTCHRVESNFMAQCGDPSATGFGGPGYQYADELTGDEEYPAGTLAMANTGPDTNGSQFFMVSGDASHLEASYTVFGAVTEESLEAIREIDANWSDREELPSIKSVKITS